MLIRLISPLLRRNNYFVSRIPRVQKSTHKTTDAAEVNNEPIKFTTSKAGQWQARYSVSGKDYYYYPKSQSTIVMLSVSSFLIYFLYLREENDLDDWLRDIEHQVPLKLEEGQLRQQIELNKKAKKDVSSLEIRLQKILEIQQKVKLSSEPK